MVKIKDFDYKGQSEEELLKLCDEKYANRGNAKWLYWPSEVYSFGKYYREQAFYPSFLPLYVYSVHGIDTSSIAYQHEIENDAKSMLVFSEEKQKAFMEKSKVPCYITTPPLVWYRKHHKVQQDKSAKGIIAFPSHSTPEIDSSFDVKKYIKELKSLPEDMQPACVCLHMHDINKGQHKVFIENNIPVYTAGNAFDKRYGKRFYDILKHFKYSCSNQVGSYTFYSIEMGIPFSLFGDECEYYNKTDKNLPFGKYAFKDTEIYQKKRALFYGINKKITKEQEEFVNHFVNSPLVISRLKLAKILWLSYFKHKIRKVFK